jgi:hypothetical protein
VALIIGPFNGPLLLLIRPALAAGNTCILTLSEALPATTEVLLALVPKYFDPGAVTFLPGGKEQNTELLKLPFDFIFFTGSTVVGKVVARAAAQNLTPILLELGGMNPALVDETANISDAAKKIVWGAMAWGGQWCTSPGYAYVHESVSQVFVAEARKALIELFGDDPKSNSDYSRIINARTVDTTTVSMVTMLSPMPSRCSSPRPTLPSNISTRPLLTKRTARCSIGSSINTMENPSDGFGASEIGGRGANSGYGALPCCCRSVHVTRMALQSLPSNLRFRHPCCKGPRPFGRR